MDPGLIWTCLFLGFGTDKPENHVFQKPELGFWK